MANGQQLIANSQSQKFILHNPPMNQPIKTAILSFGLSGKAFHAPFIQLHPGFELTGIWERTKSDSIALYPGIHIYRSLEEILDDTSIELVVVNTPTNTHYEYTKKVLLAGKHAVVEKAFTTTVAEALELKELAEKQNLQLSVFQNRRWDSDFKTVQKVIAEGLLGEIVEAEIRFDRFKNELSPKAHKETPGPGAGILNQVREPLPGYILFGRKGSFFKSRGDIQEANLIANHPPNLTDWGTEPISEQGLLHTEIDGKIIREKIPSLQGNYYDYYDGVYHAIRQNSPMPVTAEEGIHVMKIIDIAFQSQEERRVKDRK